MVDNPYKIAGNILSASLESDYNLICMALRYVEKKIRYARNFIWKMKAAQGISPCTRYFQVWNWSIMTCIWNIATRHRVRALDLLKLIIAGRDAVNVHLENIAIVIWLPVIYPFVPYRENHIPRHFLLLIIME